MSVGRTVCHIGTLCVNSFRMATTQIQDTLYQARLGQKKNQISIDVGKTLLVCGCPRWWAVECNAVSITRNRLCANESGASSVRLLAEPLLG